MRCRAHWSLAVAGLAVLTLLTVPLLPGSGSSLVAQEREEVVESRLATTAGEFARSWASGDAEGLAPLLCKSGIRLHLDGPARSAIQPRQAMVTVRDFLRGFEEGSAELTRAYEVGGTEDRGFAEFRWNARIVGTSQTVAHTLFLSLVLSEDHWRVEELRLLR